MNPPRWARVLDFLFVALLVVTLVIAISGGFRMRVAGVRLALTSPYRTLLWAMAIVVVRHLLSPAGPIYRDLPARLAAVWRTEAARASLGALLATRPAMLLVGYFAVFMIGYSGGRPPWKLLQDDELLNLQARWDAGWYFGIAIEGYRYVPDRPRDQQNIVFYPAHPILMRIAGRLLGGSSYAFVLGGTLVVLVAFAWALMYLFRLARDLLGDEAQARGAVWLIASYPFALFFSALYAESIFLLGALGAFYHFSRREYGPAAAWGLLVGLTRPNGSFVSIPLALLAIGAWLPRWLVAGRSTTTEPVPARERRSLVPALASAAAPGIGMLVYSAYIWQLTGNPLAWAAGHAAWGRRYEGVGVLFADHYEYLTQVGLYAYTSQLPYETLNALGAIFVLGAAWPVWRRLGLAHAVFLLVNILPPLAAGGFMSIGRLSSVLFPAFIWLAQAVPDRHRPVWVTAFAALQAFCAALFYTWRPLF